MAREDGRRPDELLPANFNYRAINGSDEIINSNLTGPRERLCAQRFSSAGMN